MNESILDNDDDILKMLAFDPVADCMVLKIKGRNAATYRVTPVEALDRQIATCPDIHRDALLDARNYLFKKDASEAHAD